jgi:hypothetical protein
MIARSAFRCRIRASSRTTPAKPTHHCLSTKSNRWIRDLFVVLFMRQLQSNEKGNESTATIREIIAEKLRETPFSLSEYAFDGESCFNSLHDGFPNAWEEQLSSGELSSLFGRRMVIPLVISDPLYLLKRIRYRLLLADFRISVNRDEGVSNLNDPSHCTSSSSCFDNSRIIKMHNSLPLHLFSRQRILATFKQ